MALFLLLGCNKEKADFKEAMEVNTPAAYPYFLDKHPKSDLAGKAGILLSGAKNKPTSAAPKAAKRSSKPKGPARRITNSIGMKFVYIPRGTFRMGADPNFNSDTVEEETPQHKVQITRGFYLGKYEVTQAQWVAVVGSNPSKYKGRNHPVDQVSWNDVQSFIRGLNRKEKTKRYRLPTEAEWEYACRAGSQGKYAHGDSKEQLGRYAWYGEDMNRGHHPVGEKQPNKWGLYDMSGNISEWTQDWYGKYYYSRSRRKNPKGPRSGSYRVLRGGSWSSFPQFLLCSGRDYSGPAGRSYGMGFRLLRAAP